MTRRSLTGSLRGRFGPLCKAGQEMFHALNRFGLTSPIVSVIKNIMLAWSARAEPSATICLHRQEEEDVKAPGSRGLQTSPESPAVPPGSGRTDLTTGGGPH